MIKINLLPQRRARRAAKGQQEMVVGFGAALVAALAVFFLVHQPLQADIEQQTAANSKLSKRNKKLNAKTKDFEKLEAAFDAAQDQQEAIERLRAARAVPAWLLNELSDIITRGNQPTMTPKMARKVIEDPNRSWDPDWDPKNVWFSSFVEKGGRFTLKGGAQAGSDMTQLALRLQASVYFKDVLPQTGSEARDKRSGVSYYRITITGKVVY